MSREPMPRWLLALLCAGALAIVVPFAPWVVLAVWLGLFAERIHLPLMKAFGGRRGLSAIVTVALLVIVVVPVAAMAASLVIDAVSLVQDLLASDQAHEILVRLARGDHGSDTTTEAITSTQGLAELLMNQGDRAWAIARQVMGAAARVVIGLLILVTGMYGVLVEGKTWYAWMELHAPMQATSVKRLAAAFIETGRGLAYGIVGAGLIQSIVATIAYVVLGVPSALALGMLTLLFSVIPAIGTALVWIPVAAGLAVTGRSEAAIVLAVIGVGVIGTVDNLARPYLARRGHLALPTYVVLISMFGGIEIVGAWGLVLGPLVVRLAKEAILIRTTAEHPVEAEPPVAAAGP